MLKQLRGFCPADMQEVQVPAHCFQEDWAQCPSAIYYVEAAFAEARVRVCVFHYMVIVGDEVELWNEDRISTALGEDDFATFWAKSEWTRLLKEEEGWDLSDALELWLSYNPGL